MATLADVTEEARARVRSLMLTGDNRLKQGGPVQARKARETYEKALAEFEAAEIGDEVIRGLIERRIADTQLLEGEGDQAG
jgi:predicted negative regulator of RcsB-dependent stress response